MEERKGFGTNFGFLMAAVGSAVGLGNIWGFPNKMGASGGFTFLIIYLILAVWPSDARRARVLWRRTMPSPRSSNGWAGWAFCPRS